VVRLKAGSLFRRRDLLRAAAAGVAIAAAGTAAAATSRPGGAGIRAFKLYTGPDHSAHVLEGRMDENDRTEVIAFHFKETPAHSSDAWRDSPEMQFVITLSGTLEFTTRGGETFVLRPGDGLPSEDTVGTGDRWRLIDDQPWRRAYVVLKPGAKDSSVPKAGNQ
jgi:hypothetical protein